MASGLEGRPCPLDTLHQVVAFAECGVVNDGIPNKVLGRLVGSLDRGVRLWAKRDADVAGYAAWVIHDVLARAGTASRASSTLDLAVQLGLHATEPRLALAYAQVLVLQGRLEDVDEVLQRCIRPSGSTDDGYRALHDWAAGPYAETRARARPTRARVRTLPRQSRPPGRERPNRLKF